MPDNDNIGRMCHEGDSTMTGILESVLDQNCLESQLIMSGIERNPGPDTSAGSDINGKDLFTGGAGGGDAPVTVQVDPLVSFFYSIFISKENYASFGSSHLDG